MKNINRIIFAVVIIGLGGFWYWNYTSKKQNIVFETVPIERGNIEMIISSTGTLKATNTVEVGTQVSGVIEKIGVTFNDQVKKGQVIAKLDTRNLQSTLAQAKASVMQAEVQLKQKKRAYDSAKQYNSSSDKDLTVLEAEASVEQVRTQMELAKSNDERYRNLYQDGVVSKAEFEIKEADYERLKANYEAVKASLKRTKANVINVDVEKCFEDMNMAEANLSSAKANMKKAQINLEYAIIRAPIDGVVLARNIEVGQTVAASFTTPVLFSIANDLTKMEIEASIDEADIGFIKEGQAVNFSVDAYINKNFEGKVKEIRLQPEVLSNVVTYTVIVSATNNDMMLMPGMTANLDVTTAKRTNVLMTSIAALNFNPPAEYEAPWREYLENNSRALLVGNQDGWDIGILWKKEGDQIVPKKVKTGLSDGEFTEISSDDFSENDQVVVGINKNSNQLGEAETKNPFMPSRPGGNKKQTNE